MGRLRSKAEKYLLFGDDYKPQKYFKKTSKDFKLHSFVIYFKGFKRLFTGPMRALKKTPSLSLADWFTSDCCDSGGIFGISAFGLGRGPKNLGKNKHEQTRLFLLLAVASLGVCGLKSGFTVGQCFEWIFLFRAMGFTVVHVVLVGLSP